MKKSKIIFTVLIFILFTGCSANEASDTEEKSSTDEPQVTEEVVDQELEPNQSNDHEVVNENDGESETLTTEDIMKAYEEKGKEINLTEEEMIQIGEDAVRKFQENYNIKTMVEFEKWHEEIMYNEYYYDSFKELIQLGNFELIDVEVETTGVYPNSSFSFQWNGKVTTTIKNNEKDKTYRAIDNFSLQLNEINKGEKDYKIIRFDISLINESEI